MGERKKSLSGSSVKGSSQGDSDSESTSVSSSMQGSISSATSSLDQESSNVKGGSRQKKAPSKSISKKFSSFGSFMSSRRRAQSRLSQSSIKLSDEGSTTPTHSSSVEVSDESSNYVQKQTPKFTRAGSLRSVKIFRSKSKNKSSSKSKNSTTNRTSQISEESHLERATFSSILKDSKFPEHLKHQTGPLEPEEVLPVAKLCPYQHCSLHGHHHHHDPPPKRFAYLKRRTPNDQTPVKSETKSTDKTSAKKREPKGTKKASNRDSAPPPNDVDFSIEFYAKTRSEPFASHDHSHDHNEAEFADILFGVNSFQEKSKATPVLDRRDSIDLVDGADENLDGSKSDIAKKPILKKSNHLSMWHMIHQHMVSGLAAESGDGMPRQVSVEMKPDTEDVSTSRLTKDVDDAASQETEIRKMFAIKLVREAIEKILLPEVQDDQSTTSEVISEPNPSEKSPPEVQDDQSTTSEVISEPDPSEKSPNGGEKTSEPKEETIAEDPIEKKHEKKAPKSWSYLKKVILLGRFVKELEKVKKFNPKKPNHLPLAPKQEPETVSLRRQTTGDKKNSDEWMLDYALQKVVSELAPTQKKKVALLVKAFETVAPAQEDQQESRSNGELKRVGSELSVEADSEMKTTPKTVAVGDKEKHIKMWHMIYQHVATDIATRVGSELLLDEESTNSEVGDEDEEETEGKYRVRFTQSDAMKLVRESVDEILLPEKENDEGEAKKVDKDSVRGLQQQTSKNWSKLKKLILLKRSIKALEGFRKLKPETPAREVLAGDPEAERVELRQQMVEERKKAEQWMVDYAVQHIVTKLTPARKKRVSMLVEAFEAVVPLPEI